jgi:hypothetical protein
MDGVVGTLTFNRALTSVLEFTCLTSAQKCKYTDEEGTAIEMACTPDKANSVFLPLFFFPIFF